MGCSERTDTTLNGTELNWSVVLATLKRSFYFRSMLLYVHRDHKDYTGLGAQDGLTHLI